MQDWKAHATYKGNCHIETTVNTLWSFYLWMGCLLCTAILQPKYSCKHVKNRSLFLVDGDLQCSGPLTTPICALNLTRIGNELVSILGLGLWNSKRISWLLQPLRLEILWSQLLEWVLDSQLHTLSTVNLLNTKWGHQQNIKSSKERTAVQVQILQASAMVQQASAQTIWREWNIARYMSRNWCKTERHMLPTKATVTLKQQWTHSGPSICGWDACFALQSCKLTLKQQFNVLRRGNSIAISNRDKWSH